MHVTRCLLFAVASFAAIASTSPFPTVQPRLTTPKQTDVQLWKRQGQIDVWRSRLQAFDYSRFSQNSASTYNQLTNIIFEIFGQNWLKWKDCMAEEDKAV
jgi:hypothetical protein